MPFTANWGLIRMKTTGWFASSSGSLYNFTNYRNLTHCLSILFTSLIDSLRLYESACYHKYRLVGEVLVEIGKLSVRGQTA